MSINSILQTGVQGIHRGLEGAEKAAQSVVQGGFDLNAEQDGVQNVTQSLVDLQVNENLVKASAAVVQTASDTLGTLIDVMA